MAEAKKGEEQTPVLITGAPGSRRFDKIHEFLERGLGATSRISGYKVEATIDGETYSEDIGKYEKEKFPDSMQSTAPYFDSHLGRFVLKHQDGREWTDEELQEMVTNNPQYHPKLWFGMPNPRAGERITVANVKDPDDPYINALTWRAPLHEGEAEFNPSMPVDKFRVAHVSGNRAFATEAADPTLSGEVEFLIRQPSVDEDRVEQARERKELALEYYQGMKENPRRMLAILRLFQKDFDDDTSSKVLRNALWKIVDENDRTAGGKSSQELLIKWAELTPQELSLRETVAVASMRKLIFERAGVYEYKGTALGMSLDDVLTYLRALDHGNVLESIRMTLNLSE